jgi:hypothetical protein
MLSRRKEECGLDELTDNMADLTIINNGKETSVINPTLRLRRHGPTHCPILNFECSMILTQVCEAQYL